MRFSTGRDSSTMAVLDNHSWQYAQAGKMLIRLSGRVLYIYHLIRFVLSLRKTNQGKYKNVNIVIEGCKDTNAETLHKYCRIFKADHFNCLKGCNACHSPQMNAIYLPFVTICCHLNMWCIWKQGKYVQKGFMISFEVKLLQLELLGFELCTTACQKQQ